MAGFCGIGGMAIGGAGAVLRIYYRIFSLTATFDKTLSRPALFDKSCSGPAAFDKARTIVVSIVKE